MVRVPYCVPIPGLEPTYEGLKPPEDAVPVLGRERLEPTYEGLKRCCIQRGGQHNHNKFGAYL